VAGQRGSPHLGARAQLPRRGPDAPGPGPGARARAGRAGAGRAADSRAQEAGVRPVPPPGFHPAGIAGGRQPRAAARHRQGLRRGPRPLPRACRHPPDLTGAGRGIRLRQQPARHRGRVRRPVLGRRRGAAGAGAARHVRRPQHDAGGRGAAARVPRLLVPRGAPASVRPGDWC
jgi:hypothetical protein